MKNKDKKNRPALQAPITGSLQEVWEKKWKAWACKVNTALQDRPLRSIKTGLLLFVVGMSALSIFCFYEGFYKKNKDQGLAITPLKIIPPKEQDWPQTVSTPAISEQDYQKLLLYERYLDSLALHNPTLRDQLLRQQPGLLDTVKWLKSLYEKRVR